MPIATRLTERLGLAHPIISAPMAFAAGGKLAAAVTDAGGLGLIGGGYGDASWLAAQMAAAGNVRIGCGFITWSLRQRPELLDMILRHKPAAVFLSFDDPAPFAAKVKAASTLLILQVQTLRDAAAAIDHGADVIVAQGAEAGGHGEKRGTLSFVAETADLIARRSPEILLCAAGGIADGRGLAAALMLGADGVVVGTRLWASAEALVHPNLHAAAVAATGDDTVRTTVTDIVRERHWPARYDIRVVKNAFTARWHGREGDLRDNLQAEMSAFNRGTEAGDAGLAATIAGEAIGLVHSVEPARVIIERMVAEAETVLAKVGRSVR